MQVLYMAVVLYTPAIALAQGKLNTASFAEHCGVGLLLSWRRDAGNAL